MHTLSKPSELGTGIAIVFVATIYGYGFANLICLPLANRIKLYIFRHTRLYEIYVIGLLGISNEESADIIENKMHAFYHRGS